MNKKEKNLNYTMILHSVRKELGLSLNEYCIADSIYHLSNNPSSETKGWCYASKATLGENIGISEQAVYPIIKKLISLGLVEKNPETKYLRTTEKWYNMVVLGHSRNFSGTKETLVYNNSNNNNYNNMQPEVANDLKEKSPHKQFIEFWSQAVKQIRGISPVITGADAKNLKRILDKGTDEMKLEQMAIYFLYEFRKFSPSISTFLSAGVLNGIMDKSENDPNFWKTIERYKPVKKIVLKSPEKSQPEKPQPERFNIKSEVSKLMDKLSSPFSTRDEAED